jgi:hypothetical protein
MDGPARSRTARLTARPGIDRWRGRTALWALAVLVLAEQPAQAYTDPGSGALLWQMLVAGLVGGLFYLRKAAAWLRGKDRRQ